MKRFFCVLIFLVAVIGTPSWSVAEIDKTKENEFKQASENEGCKSIPYSDLEEKCKDESQRVEGICKTEKLACTELENDQTAASKNNDVKKLQQIRDESYRRQGRAEHCVEARKTVRLFFEKAKTKVESEKKKFEDELSNDQDELRNRNKKRTVELIEESIAYYERMIDYAQKILAGFKEGEPTHIKSIEDYETVVKNCEKFNKRWFMK